MMLLLPIIEAITAVSPSDRIVVIRTALGNRVGIQGSELNTGEHVKTGPRASVRILYPDGSKLIIGKGSEVEVGGNSRGTEWTTLESGEVRGVVKKAAPRGSGSEPTVRHKFSIRSKSAVMGVRGTDFFFTLDEAAGDVRVLTLEGTVEVAKTEEELAAGKGVAVGKGQFVTAGGKGIDALRDFDTGDYLLQLQRESPEMLKISDSTLPSGSPAAVAGEKSLLDESKSDGFRATDDALSVNSPPSPEAKTSLFRPWTFQFAGVYVKQEKGGEVKTAMPSWNPVFDFPIPFVTLGIRGHFGLMPLKSRTAVGSKDERFIGWETGVLLSVTPPILPVIAELGVGRSGWASGHSGPGGLFLANIALKLSRVGFLERVFVGVSHFDKPNPGNNSQDLRDGATNFKAGVGVQF